MTVQCPVPLYFSTMKSWSVRYLFEILSEIFLITGISHRITGDSLTSSKPNLIKSTLWMGFLFVGLLFAIALLIYFADHLLADTGALATTIDAFQLFSPIVCHLVLIGESLFSSVFMDGMWTSVTAIEGLLESSNVNRQESDSKLISKYLVKFIFSQIVPICIESYITLSTGMAKEWQRHWISRTFSFNANRVAAMHYILWVDYIASRGDFLSSELDSLDSHCRRMRVKPAFDRYLWNRLGNLRTIHRYLWQLTQQVNDRFKSFLLITMTNLFLSIIIDLYWIYGNFRFGGNPFALREWWNKYTCYYVSTKDLVPHLRLVQ